MKRRNEDDVEPVEKGIAAVLPKGAPKTMACGEPVDKAIENLALNKKPFLFKAIKGDVGSDYPQDLATCVWAGQAFPKARDKLVHRGISVPVRMGSGAEPTVSLMFAQPCGNDP